MHEARREEASTICAEGYLPLVGAIARAVSRGLPPTVEIDELVSDGVIGLMDALRRFNPDRGVGFTAYAGHRIRGAMLDGLRERDPLPRSYRRAQREAEASSRRFAGEVQFLEIDDALGIADDEAIGPESRAVEADLLHRLRLGLAALPARDREVLVMRMARGMPLRVVAVQMALSITRIAEIQARALVRLRRFLEGEPMTRARRPASSPRGRNGSVTSRNGPLLLPSPIRGDYRQRPGPDGG